MTVYGDTNAPVVLIQMVDDHDLGGMEAEVAALRRLTETDFCLTAIKARRWNDDLSPWPAPAVFGREGFGGGAADTLAEALARCAGRDRTRIIGGYSLAGLFALWAAYQTDAFSAVAAASPSVWFPGFLDYMRAHRPQTAAVYLSLGDREARTRNPVMATVADRIREAFDLLNAQGVNTTLEWNQGNHFRDAGLRTAKAFAWAMKQANARRM